MELFRPADKEPAENISTLDPQQSSRWESYSSPSLHSSRSSLDSRTTAELQPPDPALPRGPPETDQSIVPQLLIDHFVSMIDPSRAQTVDNDIARHCAFSLPAVALTLGRSNWPLLKDTYETLANDMQWKVRRTLASSIHELGVILGREVAAKDLVPIFNGFIKDLDEVRIGILKHLADFLKLLEERERHMYLPKLAEFLKMDNDRNWRFRLELAEQLGLLVPLFSPQDAKAYLAPIALTLVQDKVSAVRCAATLVIAKMLTSSNSSSSQEEEERDLATFLVTDLAEKLAQSSHWARRQTFVMLCGELVQQLPYSSFSQELLPHLLELASDRVPNVRLQVARVLGQLLPQEHYEDCTAALHDQVVAALEQLAADRDTDVREAAAGGQRVQAVQPPPSAAAADATSTAAKEEGEQQLQQHEEGGGEEEEEEGSSSSEPPSWAQIAAK